MNSEPLAYSNGRFLPESQASLSWNDLGFLWGATVTDRIRTFRQRLFRLADHLSRFRISCENAFIPQPRPDHELTEAAEELIAANAKRFPIGTELALILFATPGVADEPTLGMQARPLEVDRYRHLFEMGAALQPVQCAISPSVLDPHIKHRSRMNWWITQQKLRQSNPENSQIEPLITTAKPDQFIRETPIANILVEIEGVLISPPRTAILDGISLRMIEELAGTLGIPFAEREVSLTEISAVGECLLSNTSYCLAPVTSIGNLKKPMAGPMFQQLIRAWSELVGVDIHWEFSA